MAQMRQIGTFGLELGNDSEGLIQAEVSRVRPKTQRIQYQNAQTMQARPARFRDAIHIGAISQIADAKTENIKMSMNQGDRRNELAQDEERLFGDALEGKLRNGP